MLNGIKTIIKSSLASHPLQTLFWGNPTLQTFTDSLTLFEHSQPNNQEQIIKRAIKKLNKQKKVQITLSILYFLDMVVDAGYYINLTGLNPKTCTQGLSEKEKLTVKQMIRLYAQLLELKSNRKKEFRSRKIKSERQIGLKERTSYYESAVSGILKVIEKDFVLHYFHDKLENLTLIKHLVFISLMSQISSNLKQLSQFIQENWKSIISETQLAFRINQIYEKTLFIAKQKQKLVSLNKKCKRNLILTFYEFDSKINEAIEKQMQKRSNERKQFLSQKVLGKECKRPSNFQDSLGLLDNLSEDNLLLIIEEENFQ